MMSTLIRGPRAQTLSSILDFFFRTFRVMVLVLRYKNTSLETRGDMSKLDI
jgi:hypothetical protein